MTVDAFGMSDAGSRDANEDRILVDNALGLYVICDGMGGHHRGEVAAELAISAIRHFVLTRQDRMSHGLSAMISTCPLMATAWVRV